MIDPVSDDSGLDERFGTVATGPRSADAMRDVGTHDQPRLSYRARLFEQLQASWKSLYAFSVKLAAIFPIALIAALLVRDVTQRSLSIEPISVPKTLNDDGYTPTVAAQRLRDDLNEIIAEAQTTMKKKDVALQQERLDILVPGVGISIDTIAGAILGFFNGGGRQNITGEFTSSHGELRLQLRINGTAILSDQREIAGSPDVLLRAAAREVLEQTQPYFVAAAAYATSPSAAYDDATLIIDKLPRTDEQVARAYNLRGLILADRKKYQYAEAQYVEAFLLDTGLASAHYNLGNLLRAEHRFDAAVIQYDEALWLDPYDADTHVALGGLFIDRRDHDHAIGEFREAIRVGPLDKDAHNALGNLLHQDHRELEAEAEYLTSIRLDPHYADPHDGLGNVRLAEHDDAGAEAEFRTFVRLDPARAGAHDVLATFLLRKNEFDEAIVHYRAAIRVAGDDADAYNGLATALLGKDDFQGAIGHYRTAIRLRSGWADPHFNIAFALVQEVEADPRERAATHKLLEACRELRVAHRFAPRDGRVAAIAHEILEGALGPEHSYLVMTRENLAALHDLMGRQAEAQRLRR